MCLEHLLRQMCEEFVKCVNQDDWILIVQRLGITEETLERIEDEFPGGYNFHQRVARALEYWSGVDLYQVHPTEIGEVITTSTATMDSTSNSTFMPNFDEVKESPHEPSPVFQGTTEVADMSMLQQMIPHVVGPKATPERLIHVLKLLDKTELLEIMTSLLERSHARQL